MTMPEPDPPPGHTADLPDTEDEQAAQAADGGEVPETVADAYQEAAQDQGDG